MVGLVGAIIAVGLVGAIIVGLVGAIIAVGLEGAIIIVVGLTGAAVG